MALEEFEREELSNRNKGYARMRSIMDYGMGLLWIAMGCFITFNKSFGIYYNPRLDDPIMKGLGVVFMIYGLFRIYRGYKKNYFKDR